MAIISVASAVLCYVLLCYVMFSHAVVVYSTGVSSKADWSLKMQVADVSID